MQDYVELDRARFHQAVDGKPVDLFTIGNRNGMVVRLTNLGAKIQQILVPDRDGKLGDVALGYESIDQVVAGQASMNAFIGRYAGRIAKGRFTLDGIEHQLPLNNPPNTLHGGQKGSRFVVFEAHQRDETAVELSYTYNDGEENFPGCLASRVTYTVGADNALEISYEAVAIGKPTVVNFTSHMFFNLAGKGDVLGHLLMIDADAITPVDASLVPTGEFRPVKGTPMDFTTLRPIGEAIGADYDQLKFASGYDSNYVVNKRGSEPGLAARVVEPDSGRVLDVLSTEPGIQFYSGNFLEGTAPRDVGKGGELYRKHAGFCLEPQHFPDSVNKPHWPSTVLRPGERYKGKIVYRFSTTASVG